MPVCHRTRIGAVYLYLVAQLCPTLCDPVDCSLPSSSVYGIFQARMGNGVGCHTLLQRIFANQGSNQHLLHLRYWHVGSLPLCHLGSLE